MYNNKQTNRRLLRLLTMPSKRHNDYKRAIKILIKDFGFNQEIVILNHYIYINLNKEKKFNPTFKDPASNDKWFYLEERLVATIFVCEPPLDENYFYSIDKAQFIVNKNNSITMEFGFGEDFEKRFFSAVNRYVETKKLTKKLSKELSVNNVNKKIQKV